MIEIFRERRKTLLYTEGCKCVNPPYRTEKYSPYLTVPLGATRLCTINAEARTKLGRWVWIPPSWLSEHPRRNKTKKHRDNSQYTLIDDETTLRYQDYQES